MKKISKKTLLPIVTVTAFMIASLYGASMVYAEDVTGYPPIVQKIASKFNLDVKDVNQAFEEERSEMWNKRRINLDERLTQAVLDGKITEEQKNKILEKRDEVEAQRYGEREMRREEMDQWFSENGINPEVIRSYMVGFSHLKSGK
jgi:hypothetical protein